MSHSSWLVWVWEPRKLQAFEGDLAGHLCGSLAILVSLAEGFGNAIMSIMGSSVGYKTAMYAAEARSHGNVAEKGIQVSIKG